MVFFFFLFQNFHRSVTFWSKSRSCICIVGHKLKMGAIEWVTEGDSYECSLSKETQKLAKEELREDKNTRDQALEQIRNWIKLNPRIQNCRLGERIIILSILE